MGPTFGIEIEREDDGRWIAEVPDLPGVLAYGATELVAIAAAEALAMGVLADRASNQSQTAAHPGGKPADDPESQ